ncbi:hypothetical protein L0F63_002466, partial [Massospora cicadina]
MVPLTPPKPAGGDFVNSGLRPGPPGPHEGSADEASQEIWSAILDSVASSRATPTRNVFVLGEPNVGKSTFLNFVRHENRVRDKPTGGLDATTGLESAPPTASEEEFFKRLDALPPSSKLALTHAYVDLRDEESEDALARINFYQLADPHPRFHKLMGLALGPTQFKLSAAVIFLDWGKPWRFVETLLGWLGFLELAHLNVLDFGGDPRTVGDPEAYTAGKAMMEELTAQLARYLQEYKDAPLTHSEDRRAAPQLPHPSELTLPPGCLTRNLGLPLIIVCTKSDKIKLVEREGDYKEHHFDFIQQTLRTICLQCKWLDASFDRPDGAALIYTSIHRPASFALLRNYLLHRLLGAAGSGEGPADAPAPSVLPSYLHHFKARGLMVERESVFVPSGWDSFNKIRVLRESFQCDAVQRGMHRDLVQLLAPHAPPHHLPRLEAGARDDGAPPAEGADSLTQTYASLVPVPFSASRQALQQAAQSEAGVAAQPEQAFLAAHHAMFQGMSSGASYFAAPLPYVGTATDQSNRHVDPELSAPPPNPNANSFFRMLAMKEGQR